MPVDETKFALTIKCAMGINVLTMENPSLKAPTLQPFKH